MVTIKSNASIPDLDKMRLLLILFIMHFVSNCLLYYSNLLPDVSGPYITLFIFLYGVWSNSLSMLAYIHILSVESKHEQIGSSGGLYIPVSLIAQISQLNYTLEAEFHIEIKKPTGSINVMVFEMTSLYFHRMKAVAVMIYSGRLIAYQSRVARDIW